MSEPINNGGPAFPPPGYPMSAEHHGMPLRDYFAGQALIGLYGSGDINLNSHIKKESPERTALSLLGYAVADDMLKAREVQS